MGVKIQISLYISPSSGLFFISPDEDLLFEVETSRVNFLVSFNSDDQRNTDVATTADVTTNKCDIEIFPSGYETIDAISSRARG